MNQELLTRLVEALEGIKKELHDIDTHLEGLDSHLDSCIAKSSQGSYLCVTGNISTDNY